MTFRLLVRTLAKAIKLGLCDKHPAYCKDWNVEVWHMRNERRKVMVYVGE